MINSTVSQGKILIVDDNSEIRDIIKVLLTSENFEVFEADSPKSALEILSSKIDLIILDVMMPDMSGFDLCRTIRKTSNVPILFLTAKTSNSDLIMGYSSGGDDYLAKPFSYSELVARVKGLLRRYTIYKGKVESNEFIEYNGLRLNCTQNKVWKKEVPIDLTDTEYNILKYLMFNRGQIFSVQNIYEEIWNEKYIQSSSNTIMVFIRKLREKIEDDPKHPVYILTIWGKGYKFV